MRGGINAWRLPPSGRLGLDADEGDVEVSGANLPVSEDEQQDAARAFEVDGASCCRFGESGEGRTSNGLRGETPVIAVEMEDGVALGEGTRAPAHPSPCLVAAIPEGLWGPWAGGRRPLEEAAVVPSGLLVPSA